MNKKLVIFDLDGTLFYGNSTFDFIRFVKKDDHTYMDFIKRYKYMRIYNKICFLFFKYDWYKKKSVRFLQGYSKSELSMLAEQFYMEVLSKKKIEEVYGMIEYYRKKGYQIAIMSATLDIIADIAGSKLSVDYIYATPLVFNNDKMATGCYVNDLLHDKMNIFNQEIKDNFDEIIFYSDNKEDVKLLKQVDVGFRVYAAD